MVEESQKQPTEMILEYFKTNFGVSSLGEITWSHAVNSKAKLERFLNDPATMFIESDIRISSSGKAVAVHPPETESDLTFAELLSRITTSKQGIKFDFKDPEILVGCLEQIGQAKLKQPILLNVDILQGNGANISKFSPAAFVALCRNYCPEGILSVGWTTKADPNLPYTAENIDQMLKLCEGLPEVTFPVRACLLQNSWEQLQRLITKDGYSLSIWNNEPVDKELQDWIKANTDPAKTFYDFIDDNKDPLRFW